MTSEERAEGGQALAAVIIGPNVPWDVLSEAVRERYMRAYEVVAATRGRQLAPGLEWARRQLAIWAHAWDEVG